MSINLRHTDTNALRTMSHVLGFLRSDNNAILNTYAMFRTMSDDDFNLLVGGIAVTLLDLDVDLNNTRLVEYIIMSKLDEYWQRTQPDRTIITIDSADPNTGEVMRTDRLYVSEDDDGVLSCQLKFIIDRCKHHDYDTYVRIEH